VRTELALQRWIRCIGSRRLWLPLAALTVVRVAIPVGLVLAAIPAGDGFVDNPSVFELDGNVAAGDTFSGGVTGTRDWANSALTASGLGPDVITTTAPEPGGVPAPATFPYLITDPFGDTIYTTGGSKDILDVSNWKYTSGSVPDKDEITHAFAAAYSVNVGGGEGGGTPHTWIFFGADRLADNGDSNIGFWFFQNAISLGGPANATKATPFAGVPCPSGSSNCLPGELHRNGDILIVSAFTQGGAVGSIIVFEWQNGGLAQVLTVNAAQCTPNSPSHSPACAIINTSVVPAPPDWQYVPKAGAPNTFPIGSFFEGGIDVTALFGGGSAPCFASFLAETRSSQSPTAQLKDFVLGAFPECAVSVTKTCAPPPALLSNPTRVHYNFTGNVNNDGGGPLFNLTVVDTFPAGATNTVLNQPVTPPDGLPAGASAAYTGSFDVPTNAVVTNNVTASAAASSGGSNTVVNDHNGNPAAAAAQFGVQGTACSVTTNPALTLTKSCAVSLVPGSGGVVLADDTTIQVCNNSPDNATIISGITLTNNVVLSGPGSGTDFNVVSNLTLPPGACQTYTPRYVPSQCAGGPPTLTGGRCEFDDTVRVDTAASTPRDQFNTPLPASAIPMPQSASCHVCPFGACTLQNVP